MVTRFSPLPEVCFEPNLIDSSLPAHSEPSGAASHVTTPYMQTGCLLAVGSTLQVCTMLPAGCKPPFTFSKLIKTDSLVLFAAGGFQRDVIRAQCIGARHGFHRSRGAVLRPQVRVAAATGRRWINTSPRMP